MQMHVLDVCRNQGWFPVKVALTLWHPCGWEEDKLQQQRERLLEHSLNLLVVSQSLYRLPSEVDTSDVRACECGAFKTGHFESSFCWFNIWCLGKNSLQNDWSFLVCSCPCPSICGLHMAVNSHTLLLKSNRLDRSMCYSGWLQFHSVILNLLFY